jgi:hypothetical protein
VVVETVLRELEEGNARIEPQATDWASYIVSDNDKGLFTGQWTVYSRLDNDSEDESATPEDTSPVPENARRM